MGSEEEQRKALYDYQKAMLEDGKYRKRKRRKNIILCFILVPFFMIFVSNLPFTRIFFPKYLRYYDVRLNGVELSVSEDIDDTMLFPKYGSVANGAHGVFNANDYSRKSISIQTPYLLTLKSFTCYSPYSKLKYKQSCPEKRDDFESLIRLGKVKENHDTRYKMKILKYDYDVNYVYSLNSYFVSREYEYEPNKWISRPIDTYTTIYDGELLEDLTPYIHEVGVYAIRIHFSYWFDNHGTLSFGFINDGENFIII